jgi:hypothetical protein
MSQDRGMVFSVGVGLPRYELEDREGVVLEGSFGNDGREGRV